MHVRASHRYLRMSPRKVRLLLPAVRGKRATEAVLRLRLAPQAAALPISKVIKSAIASAAHNYSLEPTSLVIDSATADQGPVLKRFMPRARGRAGALRKPTTHLTIVLRDAPLPKGSTVADRAKAVAKKAVPKKPKSEAKAEPKAKDDKAVKADVTKQTKPAVDQQIPSGKAVAKETAPRKTTQQTGRGAVTKSEGKGQQKKGQS